MTPSIHAAPQEPNMVANACLTNEQLQQLLTDAQSPESLADVSEHLEDCPRCRAALEKLTLESLEFDANFLKEMKEDPAEPALAALLDKAKQGQPAAEDSSEQLIETEIRSFLKPSDMPGSMGRLDEYEIQGIVGRGGMGIVLRGFDPSLCRTVAIKLLAPHWSVNALARRRFIREARATAAVVHEHIVTIHAVREDAPLPYLVMQFVQGVTLHDKLQKTGPLELKEVLRIGMQAAQGLAVAHAQGLVHRDIKPANILLENGVERVKITDFGLARAVDDASVTHSGVIAGTPEYMSPEQARGEVVDVRSDLFSLGSVLYSLCTGKPPYTGSNALGVVRKVADEPAPHVRRANPEIPNWLAKIISKLMAKRPEDRYPSAAEIARVLEDHLAELQNPSLVEPSAVPERNRRPLQIAAALVLLLSLFGLTYAEATGRTEMLQYVASILRIQTPHGTLVLEISDPEIKVAINADGETITVSGAGPHELTLRPGEHQWQAIRDGKTVDGWVTINRGEKEVLKVSMEGEKEVERAKVSNDPRPAQATASDPFTQEPDGSLKGERVPETEDDGHDSYSSLIERYRKAAIDAALKKLEDSKTSYLRFDITDISATPPKEPANVTVLDESAYASIYCLSQDGEHALITSGDLSLWNLPKSTPQPIPGVGSRDGVSGAAFAPNNKMFAVAVSDGLRIYSLDDLHSIGHNIRLDSAPGEVAFSGDSQILWVALNKEVIGFDARSSERVGGFYTVEGHGNRLATAGSLVAATSREKILIYDHQARKVVHAVDLPRNAEFLRLSNDGKHLYFALASSSFSEVGYHAKNPPRDDGKIVRYDLSTKDEATLVTGVPGFSDFSISADGSLLAYASGYDAKVIRTSDKEVADELTSISHTRSIKIAADGSFALIAGGYLYHASGRVTADGRQAGITLVVPSERLRIWRLDGKPVEADINESAKATVPKDRPAKPSTEKVIDPKLIDPYQVAATEAREKALKEARIAWHAQNSAGGLGSGGNPYTEVVIHTPPEAPAEINKFGQVDAPTKQVVISNNGKYGLSSHVDGPFKFWDLEKRDIVEWSIGRIWNESPQTLAFSPDSSMFTLNGQIVKGSATGEPIGGKTTLPEASSIAFAPDNNTYWMRTWDKVLSLKIEGHPDGIGTLTMPQENGSVLAVSAQNLLAVSSRNKILLYDINEKKFVGNFQHTAKISQLVFAPDGKTLYFGATGPHSYQENPPADTNPEHEVGTWTMGEATPSRALPLPLSSIDSLSVSADGKWIAAAGGTECWVQRTEEGDSKQLYAVGSIRSIALSPDGSYALVGGGLYEQGNLRVRIPSENLRLWRLDGTEATSESKATETPESTPAPEAAATPAIAVEGNVPAPQLSGSINLDSDADVRALPNFPAACFAVATSPDGKRALAGGSFDRNYLHLLQMPEGKILRSLSGHDGTITGVRFATNPTFGSFASCSYDHTVQVWDDELDLVQRYKVDSMPVDVAFSPDGQILFVCCADGLLRAWDLKEDKELIRKEDKTAGGAIAISASQGISAYKKTFDYFKFPGMTGRGARVMEDFLWSLALAPDGKNLYCGTGGEVDVASDISTKSILPGKILDVDLTILGKEVVRRFEGHKDVVKSLSLSQDGRWLLSGSLDRTARLWDTLTGREVAKLPSKEWVLDVAIAPDASYALIASGASHQGTWRFDPAENLRIWRLDGKTQAEPVSQSQPRRSSGSELRELLRPIQEFLKPPESSAVRGP